MFKKTVIFSVLFLFGLFALHSDQAAQDAYSPKSQETSITSACSNSLKVLRLEDKDEENESGRENTRSPDPLTKECILFQSASGEFANLTDAALPSIRPEDNSYLKLKIETLSARSHPPTL